MHFCTRRLAILAAALPLAAAPTGAIAQTSTSQAATPAAQRPAATLFSLDFPGGTMAELADAIREANENATIVVSEDAAAWRVPALQLRSVDLRSVGQLLDRIATPPTPDPSKQLFTMSSAIAGTSEVALSVSTGRGFQAPKTATQTWSVREHLHGGLPADDLLSAVQAMVETEPGDATVRFHEPTALLIIRGSQGQLSLVTDGLDQLRAEVRQDRDRSDAVREEITFIEDRLVEARGELRVAEKQVEVARARLNQVEEAKEEGLVAQADVSEAELEVVRADAQLQVAVRRVQRLGESLQRLEERLDD